MSSKLIPATVAVWIVTALASLPFCASVAQGASAKMKIEVQLIWGTNDAKSPNPKHKPVEPDILKKLQELPLKWTHYFEETRKMVELAQGESQKVPLSDSCELQVKNIDGTKVEVTHFGKGKKVATRTQVLPQGELLALGGNAPNATAWLVVLKRVE